MNVQSLWIPKGILFLWLCVTVGYCSIDDTNQVCVVSYLCQQWTFYLLVMIIICKVTVFKEDFESCLSINLVSFFFFQSYFLVADCILNMQWPVVFWSITVMIIKRLYEPTHECRVAV